MRRKQTADPLGQGRLLDAWIPPAKAGEALGCFATTFTFHASFFESECLGRMLQLECDPATSGASYLVEREEKMARLKSACVVADQSHARGQRSLRWDLIPFRTKNGILHAKLSILLWQFHARVIVASANLTENGYRQNLEVYSVWDFHKDGTVPATMFGSAVDYATRLLDHCRARNPSSSPALDRSTGFLASARRKVASWISEETENSRFRSVLVPVSPTDKTLLSQIRNAWPDASPPESLSILSPFFDPGPINAPAKAAWGILRQRGSAQLRFSVVAEPIQASGKLLVHAPASLAKAFPESGPNAEIIFERISSLENRALHAKALWLENADHFLHVIGSSNFTSAGLGIGADKNWELNVAIWSRLDNKDSYRAHVAAWPALDDEYIEIDQVRWEPDASLEDEPDPLAPVLPDWCGSAIFFLRQDGKAALELNFVGSPVLEWSILDEAEQRPLINWTKWREQGEPKAVELPWPDERPPMELLVRQTGQNAEARWPVEVRSFTDLPPPQGLRNLTLDQLLQILTSALPLHRCLQKIWRQNSDEAAPSVPAIVLDPLRRFSREAHLLERTRRFSLAMAGVRQRFESPIPSEEYLQWRLRGPVGVTKVAAAILNEAASEGEKAFLLGELALELSQIQPKGDAGYLSRRRIREAIAEVVADFEGQAIPLLATTDKELRRYVQGALKKARS